MFSVYQKNTYSYNNRSICLINSYPERAHPLPKVSGLITELIKLTLYQLSLLRYYTFSDTWASANTALTTFWFNRIRILELPCGAPLYTVWPLVGSLVLWSSSHYLVKPSNYWAESGQIKISLNGTDWKDVNENFRQNKSGWT